jgi:hypothetical protein
MLTESDSMDNQRRQALLEDVPPEIRGTGIERLYLDACEEGHIPMWEAALKPNAAIADDLFALLQAERAKVRQLETENKMLREKLEAVA